MRLSANRSSPHYDHGIVSRAKVFLNGREQRYVVEADEEAGRLTRCKVDASGDIAVDGWPPEIVMETVAGSVRIEIEDSYNL